MTHGTTRVNEERVLVLAPSARDADVSRTVLTGAGLDCCVCRDIDDACVGLRVGAAVAVLTEESLTAEEDAAPLVAYLRDQPGWSDQPLIVLTRGGNESPVAARFLATLGNVVLLERPVRVNTLVSTIRTAVRARKRQYQTRDNIAASERAAAELRAAKVAAEQANAAKDQFLAVLSHELRTPLSPVLGTLSLLKADDRVPEFLREDLETIRRNAELEARLIDDLLDLTRVSKGKLQLNLETLDVHASIASVAAICRAEWLAKKQSVTIDLSATRRHMRADSARLQQIFWNLLKNAIKFTPDGGKIEIRSRDVDGQRMVVEVRDTGIGIDRAVLPSLFAAFEQGHRNITRQFGGLGLGLAITRALAELHGATVEAASEGRGRGATFAVSLPTVAMPIEELTPRRGEAGEGREAGGPRPLQILLVEDHADTGRVMHRLLQSLGHSATLAATVSAALELAGRADFDLVVSDIGLPDGTGLDLMRKLKKRKRLPGIALSGFGMEEDVTKSTQAGFFAHLTKPISLAKLEQAIAQATSRTPVEVEQ